jgi:hypothetical protein
MLLTRLALRRDLLAGLLAGAPGLFDCAGQGQRGRLGDLVLEMEHVRRVMGAEVALDVAQ